MGGFPCLHNAVNFHHGVSAMHCAGDRESCAHRVCWVRSVVGHTPCLEKAPLGVGQKVQLTLTCLDDCPKGMQCSGPSLFHWSWMQPRSWEETSSFWAMELMMVLGAFLVACSPGMQFCSTQALHMHSHPYWTEQELYCSIGSIRNLGGVN